MYSIMNTVGSSNSDILATVNWHRNVGDIIDDRHGSCQYAQKHEFTNFSEIYKNDITFFKN